MPGFRNILSFALYLSFACFAGLAVPLRASLQLDTVKVWQYEEVDHGEDALWEEDGETNPCARDALWKPGGGDWMRLPMPYIHFRARQATLAEDGTLRDVSAWLDGRGYDFAQCNNALYAKVQALDGKGWVSSEDPDVLRKLGFPVGNVYSVSYRHVTYSESINLTVTYCDFNGSPSPPTGVGNWLQPDEQSGLTQGTSVVGSAGESIIFGAQIDGTGPATSVEWWFKGEIIDGAKGRETGRSPVGEIQIGTDTEGNPIRIFGLSVYIQPPNYGAYTLVVKTAHGSVQQKFTVTGSSPLEAFAPFVSVQIADSFVRYGSISATFGSLDLSTPVTDLQLFRDGKGPFDLKKGSEDDFGGILPGTYVIVGKNAYGSASTRPFTVPNYAAGIVFEDDNGNGQRDSNERGIPGFALFIDLDGDGEIDYLEEPFTVTAGDGSFAFASLVERSLWNNRLLPPPGGQVRLLPGAPQVVSRVTTGTGAGMTVDLPDTGILFGVIAPGYFPPKNPTCDEEMVAAEESRHEFNLIGYLNNFSAAREQTPQYTLSPASPDAELVWRAFGAYHSGAVAVPADAEQPMLLGAYAGEQDEIWTTIWLARRIAWNDDPTVGSGTLMAQLDPYHLGTANLPANERPLWARAHITDLELERPSDNWASADTRFEVRYKFDAELEVNFPDPDTLSPLVAVAHLELVYTWLTRPGVFIGWSTDDASLGSSIRNRALPDLGMFPEVAIVSRDHQPLRWSHARTGDTSATEQILNAGFADAYHRMTIQWAGPGPTQVIGIPYLTPDVVVEGRYVDEDFVFSICGDPDRVFTWRVLDADDVSQRLQGTGEDFQWFAYFLAQSQPPSFGSWVASLGLTGRDALPNATPFPDGIPNLVRYAMNLRDHPGTSELPHTRIEKINGVSHLVLEYRFSKNAGDVQLTPEYSSSGLSGWTAAEGYKTQMSDDDADTARYRVAVPVSNPETFIRLKTTTP